MHASCALMHASHVLMMHLIPTHAPMHTACATIPASHALMHAPVYPSHAPMQEQTGISSVTAVLTRWCLPSSPFLSVLSSFFPLTPGSDACLLCPYYMPPSHAHHALLTCLFLIPLLLPCMHILSPDAYIPCPDAYHAPMHPFYAQCTHPMTRCKSSGASTVVSSVTDDEVADSR